MVVVGIGRFNHNGERSRIEACDIYRCGEVRLIKLIESYDVPLEVE